MKQTEKVRRGRPASSSANTAQVQSLSRGLQLLEAIAEAGQGALLTDLAQQLELPLSTAHRLLNTLEQRGFVRREGEQERWFIGATGFKIGNAFLASRDFVSQAKPLLKALVARVGETANLSVLESEAAVIIAQEQCREMMRMMVPLGSRSPLHASGVGKAILSFLPASDREALLDSVSLDRITPWTLVTREALTTQLQQIRKRGWAYDDQEHAVGLRCIAACIFDESSQPIAAISVSGPLARISDERAMHLGDVVRECAMQVTTYIGGVWPEKQ